MFEKLTVFQTAHAMAVHAGHRQAVVAQNIANADTPGYQARDIRPFKESYSPGPGPDGPQSTRATHLSAQAGAVGQSFVRTETGGADPNDNTVSIEREMLSAVEVKRQHDRAVSIYKTSLGILRATLAR